MTHSSPRLDTPRHRRNRPRVQTLHAARLIRTVAGLTALAIVGPLWVSTVVYAEIVAPTLAIDITIASDGTGPFDTGAGPGNDIGTSNGVVRTNDTVTYQVKYSVNDATGINSTFAIAFPQGMQIAAIPAYCTGPTSAIEPPTAGTPSLPLQSTAVDELDAQTLTCNVGERTTATDTVSVTAKVLAVTPNGASLAPFATFTADGAATVSDEAPPVVVSSRLQWDLSTNSTALTPDSGYADGPGLLSCPWDASVSCFQVVYSLLLSAPAGGKGTMPAVGPISFTDDLTPAGLFPTLTASQIAAMDADPAKYGARVIDDGSCGTSNYLSPGYAITGDLTAATSVRNSGVASCTQPGGPGTTAHYSFTGADTTLSTFPSWASIPVGSALPGNAAYAISSRTSVFLPVATVRDFGLTVDSATTLASHNELTGLSVTGLSGETQTSAGQPHPAEYAVNWNDYKDVNFMLRSPGDSSTSFVGEPPAGVNLEKLALTPVVQSNRTGQLTDEMLKWALNLSNTLPSSSPTPLSDPDIIDVLPQQGLSGTHFSGSLDFLSAEVTAGGATTQLQYTSAPTVAQDPHDATNSPTGSTPWCSAPAEGILLSGVGLCPTSADQVTGLRVVRPGSFSPGETVAVTVTMVGIGNSARDRYVNTTFARVNGLTFAVGPVVRPQTVVASSIGDYVWYDINRDGQRTTGEPVAANVPVALSGIDDLGNPVTATTTTDSNGQYFFPGLRASDSTGYTVQFTAPTGATVTRQGSVADDPAVDSNPDSPSGTAVVLLRANTANGTVDAGLLADGGLIINKLLSGSGVRVFELSDDLVFEVECALNGESVLSRTATVAVPFGENSVTAPTITGIPVGSSCVITETSKGHADGAAAPTTVIIPLNDSTHNVLTASLTNYYSAGILRLQTVVTGDAVAVAASKQTVFAVQVTCEVAAHDFAANTVRSTVYSGVLRLTGGETITVMNPDGLTPVMFPLGTRCFGEETDDGGATSKTINFDSSSNAAVVTGSAPEDLQTLTLIATNTFLCSAALCPPPVALAALTVPTEMPGLATTGVDPIVPAGAAFALLIAGLCALLVRRARARRRTRRH